MWKKILSIIFLFYLFALLQSSFFSHFDLFGAVPNLVFILFFIVVFFEEKTNNYFIIVSAIMAGIFLDISSYTIIGPSIILLTVIGLLLKKFQLLLKNTGDSHPFVYFLPLFAVSFLIYNFSKELYLYFVDSSRIAVHFGFPEIFLLIYNALVASILFFVYRKFINYTSNGKDL